MLISILHPEMDYKETGKKILYFVFDPLVHLIKAVGIKPNHITIIGFVLNLWAGAHLMNYFNWEGFNYGDNLLGFGLILGFAGLMDTMDGRLARLYGMKTTFGAFFDSVIDRYSEFIMFFGILMYFQFFGNFLGVVLSFVALIGSIMVSYTRSRAEALGIDCSVGFMQRPERIVFVGIWCIIFGVIYISNPAFVDQDIMMKGLNIFTFGFLFLAVSTNITALRRVLHSEEQMNKAS